MLTTVTLPFNNCDNLKFTKSSYTIRARIDDAVVALMIVTSLQKRTMKI